MPRTRSLVRRAALGLTAVACALVLAACGNDDAPSGTGSGTQGSVPASAEDTAGAHNDQDVDFAQGMVPHHQQAPQMAQLTQSRATSAEVKDLASRIGSAQDPEIKTMSGWLEAGGEDVPSTTPGTDHGGHGDHDSSDIPGMTGTDDMDQLMEASGHDFDTMFLTMTIEHHEGAVDMATTEKDKGRYGPAKKPADDIVTTQTAEIEKMNKLLDES